MSLKDDFLKHKVFVQRLGATQTDVIMSQLDNLAKAAKLELLAGTAGPKLKELLRDSVSDLTGLATAALQDVAEYEASFTGKVLSKYFDNVEFSDSEAIRLGLLQNNMAINVVKQEGDKLIVDDKATKRSLTTAYKQFGNRKADELAQIIKDAQVNGSSLADTAALIDGKVNGIMKNQANALGRTTINFSTDYAKSQVLDDNYGIIQYVQWSSALEDTTCGHCEEMSDHVFPLEEAPDCPVHYNCMCELIPVESIDG